MMIQPQCFMAPCDPIEVAIATPDPVNVRYDRVYTAGQYPSTPNYTPDWTLMSGAGGLNPATSGSGAEPIFRTSTNELDRYRVLFLILGIVIGAMFLKNL